MRENKNKLNVELNFITIFFFAKLCTGNIGETVSFRNSLKSLEQLSGIIWKINFHIRKIYFRAFHSVIKKKKKLKKKFKKKKLRKIPSGFQDAHFLFPRKSNILVHGSILLSLVLDFQLTKQNLIFLRRKVGNARLY